MTKPITINIEIPEEQFTYNESDLWVIVAAIEEVLIKYQEQGGNINTWTMRAEEVELHEWDGIRLILEGESLE